MGVRDSEFRQWMIRQCRSVGWDTDDPEVRDGITVLVAEALTDGLSPERTALIADQLGVTPPEVTAAYIGEMRQAAMAEILEQPDLAELDGRLDELGGQQP
jgi:hypothetical protein